MERMAAGASCPRQGEGRCAQMDMEYGGSCPTIEGGAR